MALPRRRPRDPEGRMPLADHLRELRARIVKSGLALFAAGALGWFLYDPALALLRKPFDDYAAAHPDRTIETTYTGLTSAFSQRLSLAIFLGVIVSSPIWLYQIWAFIMPGLTKKEKRISLSFIGAAVPLFLGGVFMAHYSLPFVVGILLDFAASGTANLMTLSDYLSFVTRFILAFGIAFLLPVFLVGLNLIGILPADRLAKGWRIAVFAILVFSAMMMPTPDPFTMFLLAGPLIVFFFAALAVCKILDRRKAADRPEWLETDDTQASAL
ncbi:MAG: twin-arginine translocase subunit TatC [Dermatophilaceae bacterium]|jgi:sec-independent protein translocase protein TatC